MSRPLNPFTPKASAGNGPGEGEQACGWAGVLPQVWCLNPCPPLDDAQPGPSAGATGKDKDKALPSFWIPSLTPEAKATKLEKPVSHPVGKRPCVCFPREGQGPAVSLWCPSQPHPLHLALAHLLTLPPPALTVAHRDLPHVREASAHVGPDARALHAARQLRGPRGAHHTQ